MILRGNFRGALIRFRRLLCQNGQSGDVDASLIDRRVPGLDAPHDGDVARASADQCSSSVLGLICLKDCGGRNSGRYTCADVRCRPNEIPTDKRMAVSRTVSINLPRGTYRLNAKPVLGNGVDSHERGLLRTAYRATCIHASTMIPTAQKFPTRLRQAEITRALITFVVSGAEVSGQVRIGSNALNTAIQFQITGSDDTRRERQNSANRNCRL